MKCIVNPLEKLREVVIVAIFALKDYITAV